ncbi:uncharacterized protein LOC115880061 [Sitophilus oryzae]|uniref:Uncharacterized protein LOC115880061 n=1 Tax=Sitophilus oryzae TaxID=7048 RepID=A0A6J2XNU8_SITOR|nr:uncharacterized protein LOC115880061 [Sitophilus oryzae]
MCIDGEQQNLIVEQQRQEIKHCSKYKYLGMPLPTMVALMRKLSAETTTEDKQLDNSTFILRAKAASKQNKHKIYYSIVKSIISYGSEVWSLKEKTLLEPTEMDFWRCAAGKLDRARNEKIRNIMGVKHRIIEDIKINQLRWYGHAQRMEESRIPKKILNWTSQGKRKRGRYRRSWREGIDGDIRTRGIGENLWTDRDQWRLEIRRRRRTL